MEELEAIKKERDDWEKKFETIKAKRRKLLQMTSRTNSEQEKRNKTTSNSKKDKISTDNNSISSNGPIVIKNDYSQHFVDTGGKSRPQNFIRDSELSDRFDEYPKLKELVTLKNELIKKKATPPMYIKCDLRSFDLQKNLQSKFDVILIDPPWEEYYRRAKEATSMEGSRASSNSSFESDFWSFEEIASLKIENIAETPSFIFLWCGSEDGLDLGRLLLKKWGFRRCEDIVWLKTNKFATKQKPLQKEDVGRKIVSDVSNANSIPSNNNNSSSSSLQTESSNKESSTASSKEEINNQVSGMGEFNSDPPSYSEQETTSEIGETLISENTNSSQVNRPKKKHIFRHTKEHCLMGIKGTVRRNQDGHIIHANIDTDIVIAEDPVFSLLQNYQTGQTDDLIARDIPFKTYLNASTQKPEELYHVIEHFCLGRRRIELFGTDNNLRPGWVTIGSDISLPIKSNYSPEKFKSYFASSDSSESQGNLLGTTPEIEDLRPKSPSVTKNLTGK